MPPLPSKTKSKARLRAERDGRWGEAVAALYLRGKLYRIRARRVKTPLGEIDIVAERSGTVVFVEVKSRAFSTDLDDAMFSVNHQRIMRAAMLYIARHKEIASAPMRFDVIFVAPFAWPRHVKGAFDAS